MVKIKRSMAILLAAVLTCICLVSCGSGDFEGKWECEEMSVGGMTIKDNFMGIPIAVSMQIELKSDGKGTHYKTQNGTVAQNDISWEKDGSKCKVTVDGKALEFELKSGKLVAEYSESGQTAKVVLKKVDKFTEFTEEDAKKVANDLVNGNK